MNVIHPLCRGCLRRLKPDHPAHKPENPDRLCATKGAKKHPGRRIVFLEMP